MSFELILPFFPHAVRQLILDDEISDLCLNEGRKVFVERKGIMSRVPGVEMEPERANVAIQQIARILGQNVDEDHPLLDTRLPNGSRVSAVFSPCSPAGVTITVRKFNRWFTTDELVEMGTLPCSVRAAVIEAILDRRNILVSGGTGSGKSTLLKAFADHIPNHERLIVIEKPIELALSQENCVRWEAVDELPGRPEITVAHLLRSSLRHRPDRIVIGEVRDHSAFDMLQAMNTGHSGSLTTTHADSASLALARISDLALSARPNLDHSFVRAQTAEALHFVLQAKRDQQGMRRVTEFVKVLGYRRDSHEFETETLYKFRADAQRVAA